MNPTFRTKLRNNGTAAIEQHGWYYYPKMTANEAVIFKQYDETKSEAQVCIHAAIDLEEDGPKPLPERQSIEVRAIVLFDGPQSEAKPSVPASIQSRQVQVGYQNAA